MRENSTWTKFEFIFISILGITFGALMAIYSGQDINPDLVNYHFYSGYLSFNKDRLLTDVIPSNIQGYLNPYVYSLYYILHKIVSPIFVSLIIGGIHGINFVLIYLIARLCLNHLPKQRARFSSFVCAIFGLLNPFFLAMLGASWSDNLTPILILAALAIIIHRRFSQSDDLRKNIEPRNNYYAALGIAGLFIGFSVGFKLTNIAFVIGLVPAWLVGFTIQNKLLYRKYVKEVIFTFSGITIGFLIINGSWMWSLWSNFQNPLFPFYNGIFKSQKIIEIWTNVPAIAAAKNLADYIIYPFNWMMGIPPETEWNFRDPRFAVIYVLFFLVALSKVYNNFFKPNADFSSITKSQFKAPYYIIGRWKFLLVWASFSYLFWINQFGALRYLMPVTLLTGVIIFILLNGLFFKEKVLLVFFVIIGAFCLAMIKQPPYGRLSWDQRWYPVTLPELIAKKPAIYFNRDLSFVVPFFPKESKFFGYLYLDSNDELTTFVKSEIARNSMPMRTLTTSRWSLYDDAKLEMLSLRRNPYDCVNFEVAWAKYETCSVEIIHPGISPIIRPELLRIDLNKIHLAGVSEVNGFDAPELGGSWSLGNTAEVRLIDNLPANFNLILNAFVFAKNSETGIDIVIGDQKRRIKFDTVMGERKTSFSFASSKEAGSLIRFEIPHPTSPSSVDSKSGDVRKLGVFVETLKISPMWPMEVDFSRLNDQLALKEFSGFSIQEPTGRWSEGPSSNLIFNMPLPSQFRLSMKASTLPHNFGKLATISVGKSRYTLKLLEGVNDYKFDIRTDSPPDISKLEFKVPFAISPKEIGMSADSRKLGIFIEKMVITPYPTPIWPMEIDFGHLSDQPGLKEFSGFSFQETTGRWSEELSSSLVFDVPLPTHFWLSMKVSTLPHNVGKIATIDVGKSKYNFKLLEGVNYYKFDMRTDSLLNTNKLEFEVPFSISPKEIGMSTDSRKLGIFIEKIIVIPFPSKN